MQIQGLPLTPAPLGGTPGAIPGAPGPIGSGAPLGQVGPADQVGLSPDVLQAGNFGNLDALMQAMDPKQLRVMQLQAEIQQTQAALTQAQATGNQPLTEQLQQRLQQLQAELQQLMGGEPGQSGGGAPGGGAPGVDASGGGAPGGGAPGGGAPGGGAPGGGAPGGGAPGGGAPGGGAPGGVAPVGRGGPAGGPGAASGAEGPGTASAIPSPELQGNDAKLASAIEEQLKGTPLEGKGLGAHFVQAGRQRNVDPLALVAISKHETNHGKLGVGIKKHMGVGAYDHNPNGRTPYDGAVQQIYSGARTFDNLRRKGGSNSGAPMSQQLAAVNRAGWATDRNWHSKVGKAYNGVVSKANNNIAKGNQRS